MGERKDARDITMQSSDRVGESSESVYAGKTQGRRERSRERGHCHHQLASLEEQTRKGETVKYMFFLAEAPGEARRYM